MTPFEKAQRRHEERDRRDMSTDLRVTHIPFRTLRSGSTADAFIGRLSKMHAFELARIFLSAGVQYLGPAAHRSAGVGTGPGGWQWSITTDDVWPGALVNAIRHETRVHTLIHIPMVERALRLLTSSPQMAESAYILGGTRALLALLPRATLDLHTYPTASSGDVRRQARERKRAARRGP